MRTNVRHQDIPWWPKPPQNSNSEANRGTNHAVPSPQRLHANFPWRLHPTWGKMVEAVMTQFSPYAWSVIDPKTGVAIEYRVLLWYHGPNIRAVCHRAAVVEFGQLGYGLYSTNTEGTKTIHFITFKKIPESENPTYSRFLNQLMDT